MQRVIEKPNKVVITDRMWARLLSSTNQPSFMHPPKGAIIEGKQDEVVLSESAAEESNENEKCTPTSTSLSIHDNHVDDQYSMSNGSSELLLK